MESREVGLMTVVVRAVGLAVEMETLRRRDLNFVRFNSRAAFASSWDKFSLDEGRSLNNRNSPYLRIPQMLYPYSCLRDFLGREHFPLCRISRTLA